MIWLRTLLFGVTFVAAVLVYLPRWIVGREGRARLASGAAAYAAWPLIVAGVLLVIWCWHEFAARGRGTPLPIDPPRRLVVFGPYRYVRNPMYLGALLVLLGQALLYGSVTLVWYAAGFGLVVHLFVVAYEEPALRRQFGAEYDAYRAAVGRWVPRLRPYEQHAPTA